jgi:16S rRNA (guanine527-N7)-methyltransferase
MRRAASASSGGEALAAVVAEAQRHGFVGKGPVSSAIEHARGFAAGVEEPPGRVLDLGSGGGLPGLALADEWPTARVTLLDSQQRRCAFLRAAVEQLGYDDRVEVVEARAEIAGRQPGLRGGFDVVTARSFGRPAVTAECGAPFLRVEGWLVVSEPPGGGDLDDSRWPAAGLAMLGLSRGAEWASEFRFQSLVQTSVCPDRYPRRVGVPGKRPLF